MGSMLARHFFSCMWEFIRPSQCLVFDGFCFGLLPDESKTGHCGESLRTNLAVWKLVQSKLDG